MIPNSRPKHSDLYTLSQSKLLENHTLYIGTYLYMAVPPPSLGIQVKSLVKERSINVYYSQSYMESIIPCGPVMRNCLL